MKKAQLDERPVVDTRSAYPNAERVMERANPYRGYYDGEELGFEAKNADCRNRGVWARRRAHLDVQA